MAYVFVLLIALLLLLHWLSSATKAPAPMRSFARAVILIVLALGMAGFGLCGAAGVMFAVFLPFKGGGFEAAATTALPGALGLLIAVGAYRRFVKLWRKQPDKDSRQ